MSKPRSERSRWTQVYILPRPIANATNGVALATQKHDELLAVVKAFEAVGRVVRVEAAHYGEAIVVKARRS